MLGGSRPVSPLFSAPPRTLSLLHAERPVNRQLLLVCLQCLKYFLTEKVIILRPTWEVDSIVRVPTTFLLLSQIL